MFSCVKRVNEHFSLKKMEWAVGKGEKILQWKGLQ
jgi:hypothetical protein